MKVLVMKLGIRKGKRFSEFLCSYEHESREYTLQEKDKSPSDL